MPNLFFVALLPDETIQREVTDFKQVALERFQSGHALKSPPHITLVPPFQWNQSDILPLLTALQQAASKQAVFPVGLHNFNRFDQRVIFVDVRVDAALANCQRVVADTFFQEAGVKPETRPFHPHMTVAFRDLTRSRFPEAWTFFSSIAYERTFEVRQLTLLRHTGQRWEVAQEAPLIQTAHSHTH